MCVMNKTEYPLLCHHFVGKLGGDCNYISAIKSMFRWFNLNVAVFAHPKVNAMLRAVEVSVHKTPIQKGILTYNFSVN